MNLINLTPHDIHVIDPEGSCILSIPSSGVARCSVTRQQVDSVDVDGVTVPVNQSTFGAVEGLPEPVPGTLYIVSMLTAQAAASRTDLLITDDAVRDEQGRVIGCKAFARV